MYRGYVLNTHCMGAETYYLLCCIWRYWPTKPKHSAGQQYRLPFSADPHKPMLSFVSKWGVACRLCIIITLDAGIKIACGRETGNNYITIRGLMVSEHNYPSLVSFPGRRRNSLAMSEFQQLLRLPESWIKFQNVTWQQQNSIGSCLNCRSHTNSI